MANLLDGLKYFSATIIEQEELSPPVEIVLRAPVTQNPILRMTATGKNAEQVWMFDMSGGGTLPSGIYSVEFTDKQKKRLLRDFRV